MKYTENGIKNLPNIIEYLERGKYEIFILGNKIDAWQFEEIKIRIKCQ